MNGARLSLVGGAILLALGLRPLPAFGAAGQTGFSLLKLGVSGEGVALGDAMTAASRGAASTAYNPAGMLRGLLPESAADVMFTHREWIQDTRLEFLAACIRFDAENALGISLQTATVSDIEIRTRPGPAEGTFTARTFVLGLSYARALDTDLRIGATVKMVYQKILVDDGAGFGLDVGVQYDTGLDGLSLGASVANLGSGGTLREEKSSLPALGRIGGIYRFSPMENAAVAVMGDVVSVFPDKQTFVNLGGELRFQELVAVRGGYQLGSEGRGFSAGLGIAYGIVAVDYAYAPLSLDLGNTHTISVSVSL
jgi:hypothetical protein